MKRSLTAVVSIFLVSAIFCGCISYITEGSTSGTTAYIRGKLHTTVETSLLEGVAASKNAAQNMKFTNVSEKLDAVSAMVILRTSQNKKITIKLNKITDNTTKLSIKAGLLGDQALSYNMLEEIKKYWKPSTE
jgi:hypothetical protein